MPKPTAAPSRPPWLWIGIGAIVVVALVVAVLASRGGSDEAATDLPQTQPVTASGNPLPTLADSGTDAAVGTVAPTLHGKSFDGSAVDVAPGTAKLVLFVAHWCPHCQREVPLLVDHLKRTKLPAGVELVTVATSTSKDAPNYPPSTWLDDEGWTAPVLADDGDGTAAQAYGLPGFPYLVALDADGKVVGRVTGEFSTDTFDQLAREAAAG
jgi:thiol-disulfide isomerase/thioredoxin